jgi:hypothetical protein
MTIHHSTENNRRKESQGKVLNRRTAAVLGELEGEALAHRRDAVLLLALVGPRYECLRTQVYNILEY